MTDFSKMTVQSVIALEARTAKEQAKRQSLLSNPKKLESYAKEKEIKPSKMKGLLSGNYKNNVKTLKAVRDYIKTSAFQEKKQKQKKAQKTVRFKIGGGGSNDAVKTIFEGPSLIKMDDLK